jgi:hypothetical protein
MRPSVADPCRCGCNHLDPIKKPGEEDPKRVDGTRLSVAPDLAIRLVRVPDLTVGFEPLREPPAAVQARAPPFFLLHCARLN